MGQRGVFSRRRGPESRLSRVTFQTIQVNFRRWDVNSRRLALKSRRRGEIAEEGPLQIQAPRVRWRTLTKVGCGVGKFKTVEDIFQAGAIEFQAR